MQYLKVNSIKVNSLLGFAFALFLNLEGILTRIFNLQTTAGFFNQFYAPLFLLIAGIFFVFKYHVRVQNKKRDVSILFLSTVCLSLIAILTSYDFLDIKKLIRDLTYIWIIYLIFQINLWKQLDRKVFNKSLIQSFTISFLLLFPLSSLFFIPDSELERFSGWTLSKPQFANMVLLTGILYLNESVSSSKKHLISIICLVLIFFSGTRTPLLLFLIYYLYHFFIYHSRYIVKKIALTFGITLIIGVLLFWVFAQQIQTIIAFAGNFRAFSFEDIEGGSIFSRLTWYTKVMTSLINNNYFGGFGSGASERLIGFITHFDFLRYWYDYTLLFGILFMTNLYKMFYHDKCYITNYHKAFDGLIFLILISTLMMHNVFQSFDMVILIMLFLIKNKDHIKYDSRSCFYRIPASASSGIN